MSEDRLYILAGSYSGAAYWAQRWGLRPSEWRYVSSERILRGMHGLRYVIPDLTFYDRSDATRILDSVRMAGGREAVMDQA